MKWVSSRGASPPVPFIDELFAGTAPDGGLYMPEQLDPLSPEQLAAIRAAAGDIVEIGTIVGSHLLRDEISVADMRALVRDALDFPIPLVQVTSNIWSLELFHGPTMAFKDVGARTQARLLHHGQCSRAGISRRAGHPRGGPVSRRKGDRRSGSADGVAR